MPVMAHWQKPVFILFLVWFAVLEVCLILRIETGEPGRWMEGCFLITATVCALLSLAQRLPFQNVLMAAVLIFCMAALVVGIASVTAVPFGPFVYSDRMGPRLFDAVPWAVPTLWIVIVVTGRGVARLIMRPWRKTNFYGFWVMGLTGVLAVVFDLGFEPFAVSVKHYWMWRPTLSSWIWHQVPWVNFLGWFVTTLAILALTLPWLINKQPVKRPMDYLPLIQWMIVQAWIFTGNAMHGFQGPCTLIALGALATLVFAVRGARW